MDNQDMPAGAQSTILYDEDCGETKREKAFWMVLSSMMGHPGTVMNTHAENAEEALKAVNAGFKALEQE